MESLDERCEIWVNTTGAHLKTGMMEELKGAGLFGIMVSVHSPDSAKHDAFTGVPGAFETACSVIKIARGLNVATALNTVLSEEELRQGHLSTLMDFASGLDCDFVQLIHPKPAGIWMGRKEGMQTDRVLIESVRREHLRYNSTRMRDYPSLAAQVFEESEKVFGCTSGAVDRFYVNATGEIQPCEFVNLSFGNVNEEPFNVIYERMRSCFKVPCVDWLCCTQAESIVRLFTENGLKSTPLPWGITRQLVENWNRGEPTPIYRKLGIYR
jgi:MoaA/NifB/PqqE/SkfB family radical SAM enzyme